MGEEFGRDPFLLFTLRGLSREDLLDRLRPRVASAGETAGDGHPGASGRPEEASEPLPSTSAAFWAGQTLTADTLGQPRTPPVAAALLRGLGRFPFWPAEQPLLDALEPIYRAASPSGWPLYAGDYKGS